MKIIIIIIEDHHQSDQESEDLELCFTLDRIVETTEEDKCFQVVIVTITITITII